MGNHSRSRSKSWSRSRSKDYKDQKKSNKKKDKERSREKQQKEKQSKQKDQKKEKKKSKKSHKKSHKKSSQKDDLAEQFNSDEQIEQEDQDSLNLQQSQQIQQNQDQDGKPYDEFLEQCPENQQQFRYVLLEFLNSDFFVYPCKTKELVERIKDEFSKRGICEIEQRLQCFDLIELLKEFSQRGALDLEEHAVGKQTEYFIMDLNKGKLRQLSREFYKDRPKKRVEAEEEGEDDEDEFLGLRESTRKNGGGVNKNLNFGGGGGGGQNQIQWEKDIDKILEEKVGIEQINAEKSLQIGQKLFQKTEEEEKIMQSFKTADKTIDFCAQGTAEKCKQVNQGIKCLKAHFIKIIKEHTDISKGNCSYLNTCRHMDQCIYIHYEIETEQNLKKQETNGKQQSNSSQNTNKFNPNFKSNQENNNLQNYNLNQERQNNIKIPQNKNEKEENNSLQEMQIQKQNSFKNEQNNLNSNKNEILPPVNFISNAVLSDPQWVNCDMKSIDFSALGKFNVIMADPPWDIHMTLPYETMKDKEMKALRIDLLQDDGLIFLWVTGRAMEIGRDCLKIWGYNRVEEIIWVKTNQLQRIIRTGRTGHWLNHSKEHCLVGIKGNPKINAKIDCDVLVSEVRETSRKPDEIYSLIERMSQGGKKIELYGRPKNCMPGWVTLGNQLPGIYLYDEEIRKCYKEKYPNEDLSMEKMEANKREMQNPNRIEEIYNSHISSQPPFKVPK